jgi:hypothetical protein
LVVLSLTWDRWFKRDSRDYRGKAQITDKDIHKSF